MFHLRSHSLIRRERTRRVRAETPKKPEQPTSAACRACYSPKRSTKVLGHTLCQITRNAYRQCAFEISLNLLGRKPQHNQGLAVIGLPSRSRHGSSPGRTLVASPRRISEPRWINRPEASFLKASWEAGSGARGIFLPIPLRSPPHLPELAAPTPLGGLADDFTSGQRMRLTERQEL
jgi:hypothetical protein